MATTLLIRAIDITKGTPLGGNIDVNKYLPVIKEVQIFVVEKILGTALYNKLLTDYAGDVLAGDYLILVENYIQPILIHSTAAEFIIQNAYTVGNGGIFKHLPENAESVSKDEVAYLAQQQRNKADVYIKRLEDFLCATSIPEFTAAQTEDYDINPTKQLGFTGGWDLSSDNDVQRELIRRKWGV